MSTFSFAQKDAPLFDNFHQYSRREIAAFHTPGHRGGRGCEGLFRRLGGDLLALDLTELKGANLEQDPDFLLRAAEKLAAEAFGAAHSYFLVNGASSGVVTAFLALKGKGSTVLVARNAHVSVLNGLVLSGLKPIFLSPTWVEGLPCLPAAETVAKALAAHPQVAGVFVTNPGYHGIYGPLDAIATLCQARKVPLVVDEAHGGHLRYIDPAIPEASRVGADLWVWGLHKLMGSLTQTGVLHLGSTVFSREAVEEALTLVSSTSPSYLLLSSLDSARRQLYFHGREMFTQAAELGSFLRRSCRDRPRLKIMTAAHLPPGYGLDPTKVVVSLTAAGWSGLDAEEILRRKYGVQAEYADRDYLYFFISYAQKKQEVTALGEALLALAATPGPERGSRRLNPPPWAEAPLRLSPRAATQRPAVYLNLAEAAGQIAAGWVGAYPPGIPLWVPGEEITRSMLEWLTAFQAHGGYVRGLQQGKVKVIIQ